MQTTFSHPLNGTRDTISAWSTCGAAALLGPLYFTFVGAWTAASVLWILTAVAIATSALPLTLLAIVVWTLLALMAFRIRSDLYRQRGWVEMQACACVHQTRSA